MKTSQPQRSPNTARWILYSVLFLVLVGLFWKIFLPQYIIFSNDGSYAIQESKWTHLPESFLGSWYDLNTIGVSGGAVVPNFTQTFRWFFGGLGYSKFIAPVVLWCFGAAAFFFFRRAGLSNLAAILGGIGACLTTNYFSNVAWGSVPPTIALTLDLLAMGALIKRDNLPAWVAPALAGFAVGANVIEAADIGALLSLMVAAFVMYHAIAEDGKPIVARVVRGVWRTAVVAIFAGFIAAYTVSLLIGVNITGIVGTKQDPKSKAEHYAIATQWSLPKKETLSLFIPNLFGCNIITPGPATYWGNMGTDASWDAYMDNKGPVPLAGPYLRHTGRGFYIGAMIVLIAGWAGVQSLRKKDSVFTDLERRFIWFWWGLGIIALLLAWGRHAPFYWFIYQLPYFSTIRSPEKYLHILNLAMIIVFAYGIHGLSRRYLDVPFVAASKGRFKTWWAKASQFERRWVVASIGIVLLSVVGWAAYAAMHGHVVDYLADLSRVDDIRNGHEVTPEKLAAFHDGAAAEIAFSLKQVAWFVMIIAACIGMLLAIMAGAFAGRRARWAGVLLGLILIVDLVHADYPYIVFLNYKEKYEIGNPEPMIKFLADKAYERRVAYIPPFPLRTPDQFEYFDGLYHTEWTQHLFPVYDIPTLDIVQMPRTPEDLINFTQTIQLRIKPDRTGFDENTAYLMGRFWQLTASRYLVGPAFFLDWMNQNIGSGPNRFRAIKRFDLAPRPDVDREHMTVAQLLAAPTDNPNAPYALIEDTAALPRASLFCNWEVVTNDDAALERLTERSFDPTAAVVLTKALPVQPSGTNTELTNVKITSYKAADIHLEANPTKPSVLMMADKFDPGWQVYVDGKRAEVLKCNYLMRGVYLEPGKHEVEFRFRVNVRLFYENLFAIAVALCLLGYALVTTRKRARNSEASP